MSDRERIAELSQALGVATRALQWYAAEKSWSEDDWGVRSVVRPPDYGEPGKKARNALKRVKRIAGSIA